MVAIVPAATVMTVRAAEVVFERIDTHNHIHRSAPALVAAMDKTGWRGLSICDSREVGDQVSVLPEMISGTTKFHHMFGRPDAPSKETILAARDRIVARYPKLRVIGCHLGSNEEDLDRLAKRLDALPNLVVDVASRVRYLMASDRETTRRFVLKYQDRILYATDFTRGLGDDEHAASSLQAIYDREWNVFATGEIIPSRDRPVQGLALP